MSPEGILEVEFMLNTSSFQSVMSDLPDPRQSHNVVYPLSGILLLSRCGAVSGCDSFVDIAGYDNSQVPYDLIGAPKTASVPSPGM